MSRLDDARAEVARLEAQEELEQALRDAAEAHEANPSADALAAHNAAAEALVAHRAKSRPEGTGPRVGGDAVVESGDQS